MNNPLISIIIPVYNTRAFLAECFDSVIKQTYSNFEVIVVNDGSTDGSDLICKEYERKDLRFKIITKQNEGVSIARNTALNKASGQFICFVDSDDIIDKKMLETFASIAEDDTIDFVQSNGYANNSTGATEVVNTRYTKDEALTSLFHIKDIRPSLCLGLYKTSIFSSLRLPSDIHCWEDFAINAVYLSKCKNVVSTNQRFYNYRYRVGSSTKQPMNDRQMSCLFVFPFLKESNVIRCNQDIDDILSFFIRCCFLHYILHTPGKNKRYSSIIRKEIWKNRKSVYKSMSVSSKTKLMMYLFLISEDLTSAFCNYYYKRVV